MKRIKYLFFSGQQRTIIHWQAWELLPAHIYTIQLKPPPILDIIGHNKISGGPKKCFFECLPTFKKKKKRQYSIYCFYGASRREQEVKRILIGTTHKSLYKNENRNTKKKNSSPQGLSYTLSQILKKENWIRMIYIERIMEVYFY